MEATSASQGTQAAASYAKDWKSENFGTAEVESGTSVPQFLVLDPIVIRTERYHEIW